MWPRAWDLADNITKKTKQFYYGDLLRIDPKRCYFWPVWHFAFRFIKDPGFRVSNPHIPRGNIHQLESRNSKFKVLILLTKRFHSPGLFGDMYCCSAAYHVVMYVSIHKKYRKDPKRPLHSKSTPPPHVRYQGLHTGHHQCSHPWSCISAALSTRSLVLKAPRGAYSANQPREVGGTQHEPGHAVHQAPPAEIDVNTVFCMCVFELSALI
jgi:hypothetical protein